MSTLDEIEATVRNAAAGGQGLCATFEVDGSPDRWIQYVDDQLNVACPLDSQPDALVAELGLGRIVGFERRVYLTLEIDERDPAVIANWIDAWCRRVLGAADNYQVSARLEQL